MSIDNAMDRLKAANPAPDKRLLRAELDDLNVLLSATWQRSTNVQTEPLRETQQAEKKTRGGWLVAAAAFAVVPIVGVVAILIATNSDKAPAVRPAGPITIEFQLDVTSEPGVGTSIVGPFEVTEGSDILGCSAGTFVDDQSSFDVTRTMTCSGPNTGTFTIGFGPLRDNTEIGIQNSAWFVLDGVADFIGLQGGGDWWADFGTTETITGDIEFAP